VLYVFGKFNKWYNYLFMCFAILCAGACVLFITGVIGSFSLCVLIYILSFSAVGFMFTRYFWFCFSIKRLLFCNVCWIVF